MPTHAPESLVKFCSADSAKTILKSQSLRWSAPNLYTDPFELNHETGLNFDPHVLLQGAIQAATAMIFAKDKPVGNTPLVNAIRRWRDEERFDSPEEAEDVLRELLSQMVDQRQQAIDQMMADWRRFTRSVRICSFSAKPDNLAAWQMYAERHCGAAIRLQSGEHTSLPKPKAMAYRNSRPEITTLKEQLDVVLNNTVFRAQDYFLDKFTTKPSTDSAEQEWRCFHLETEKPGEVLPKEQWFNDRRFERGEVTAVYLGIFMPTKDKRDIYQLVKEEYHQAKLFQAKVVPGKYELEFERIPLKK